MIRKPPRWAEILKQLFSPVRKRRTSTRLSLEELNDRIVLSTYNVTALKDGVVGNTLRHDISIANADPTANATETFLLQSGATYSLSIFNQNGHETANASGDLNINYNGTEGIRTYIFQGLGSGAAIYQTISDRVFDIAGSNLIVKFINVSIVGGGAGDNGSKGALPNSTDSEGGGILNEGADLFFTNAAVRSNGAYAANGSQVVGPYRQYRASDGADSTKANQVAGAGAAGANGLNAYGGGLYSTSGTITLNNSHFFNDFVGGGAGQNGGNGGNVSGTGTGPAGAGGQGGMGGDAAGGAIYAVRGTIILSNHSSISNNRVGGGGGGEGGAGGEIIANAAGRGGTGGQGGNGGASGTSLGAGFFIGTGNVVVSGASQISSDDALDGGGGTGGAGGEAAALPMGIGGRGGNGGTAENAGGGGIFAANGGVIIQGKSIVQTVFGSENESAQGADGGGGGAGGKGSWKGGAGGDGGDGGQAQGGGVYAAKGVTITTSSLVEHDFAIGGVGGQGGAGGVGVSGTGGNGGTGGNCGTGAGGGVYVVNGAVTVIDAEVSNNSAFAGLPSGFSHYGQGGPGGFGRKIGGNGGNGGNMSTASGGGIYCAAGNVILNTGALVSYNKAVADYARVGSAGGSSGGVIGGRAGDGGNGGSGGTASGGGIFAASGNVTVENKSGVENNAAIGYQGGNGAAGRAIGSAAQSAHAGNGGNGGSGASTFGGGIYIQAGTVTIENTSDVTSNFAQAAAGEPGGAGGNALAPRAVAGIAGMGGVGGTAEGGGIYSRNGAVIVNTSSSLEADGVGGGKGGAGGQGGDVKGNNTAQAGSGGAGGSAGTGAGGAVYILSGNLTIENDSLLRNNDVTGKSGGTGGAGGRASGSAAGGAGLAGGVGGSVFGGGAYVTSGNVRLANRSYLTGDDVVAGPGGGGGNGGHAATGKGGADGVGGTGGIAEGGGIWTLDGSVTVSGSAGLNGSTRLIAGDGGHGGAGGGGAVGGEGSGGGNGGTALGGGIYTMSGTVSLNLGHVFNDTVQGGLGLEGTGAIAAGGGIYSANGVVNLTNAGIENGQVTGGSDPGGTGGYGMGGGVFAGSGDVNVLGSNFIGNSAKGGDGRVGGVGSGGGIADETGLVAISGPTAYLVSNNAVGGHSNNAKSFGDSLGGGVFIGTGGSLSLAEVDISDNVAGKTLMEGWTGDVAGAGLYVSAGGILNISQSSIVGNFAFLGIVGSTASNTDNSGNVFGGGLYAASTSTIVDSTFGANAALSSATSNSATGLSAGGGVFIANNTSVVMYNSTVVENAVTPDVSGVDLGDGIRNDGTLALVSTLVAQNGGTGNANPSDLSDETLGSLPAGTTAANDSLIQNPSGNSITASHGNIVGVAPILSTLVHYIPSFGNPSANWTEGYFLEPGSPGIGAGSNPLNLSVDQFGDLREIGGETDIGAIESPPASTPYFALAIGNGFVRIVDQATGAVLQDFQPFPGYSGLVRVALGNVFGDEVQDLIVAAEGKVKVYDGRDITLLNPDTNKLIDFNKPSTWVDSQGNSILESDPFTGVPETTPLVSTITPFKNDTGDLYVAAGDVNGDGHEDIVVGTGKGIRGQVAVFSGANPSIELATWMPFGASYAAGVVVAAGNVVEPAGKLNDAGGSFNVPSGPADVVVGTASTMDVVKIYSIALNEPITQDAIQVGKTLIPFGSSSGVQLAVVYPEGYSLEGDVVVSTIFLGVGVIHTYDAADSAAQPVLLSNFIVGKNITALTVTQFSDGDRNGELLVGAIPNSKKSIDAYSVYGQLDTNNVFDGLSALTGGISLAGT